MILSIAEGIIAFMESHGFPRPAISIYSTLNMVNKNTPGNNSLNTVALPANLGPYKKEITKEERKYSERQPTNITIPAKRSNLHVFKEKSLGSFEAALREKMSAPINIGISHKNCARKTPLLYNPVSAGVDNLSKTTTSP